MPINLETGTVVSAVNPDAGNDQATTQLAQIKIFSPKFFHAILTGNGQKRGLLSDNINPGVFPTGIPMTMDHTHTRKIKMTSGTTTTTMIPVNPLTYDAWKKMLSIKRPANPMLVKFGTDKGGMTKSLFMEMRPHSIVVEETDNSAQGGSKSKKSIPCYQIFLYFVANMNDENHKLVDSHRAMYPSSNDNVYTYVFTTDPVTKLEDIARELAGMNFLIDFNELNAYVQQYSLYDHMVRRSEEWQTTLDASLEAFFQNITSGRTQKPLVASDLRIVVSVIRHIDQYSAPLDLYRSIYKKLTQYFCQDDTKVICRQNLNLLLSDTMENLNKSKPNLNAVRTPNPIPPKSKTKFAYSTEQARAIASQEPLVLVQSGAGTGKSTVILGRIDWMVANGVKPEDIMVLSFTNAAADHIKELNPNVKSMTIAHMIHTIYSTNFPDHLLSELDTLSNSLDIYFPTDDIAMKFKHKCIAAKNNEPNAWVDLNNFIEEHYPDIMRFLDTTRQTSLELEIIICYQKIDTMVEPPEIQSKHLIIDEVQDNSVFEFIYALKYVEKHQESLFIVGDCSQTLYEFRASNPRAMNVLESSGVFATHQLQVNYRSNQEILDFANVILQDIEANQYAQIQLIANSMATVTEQSFREKVRLKYERVGKLGEIRDCILPVFQSPDVKAYFDECLARGEKIAFLAYTKDHVRAMENAIRMVYPGAATSNLIPVVKDPTTVLSRFIQTCWSNIQFVPTKHILQIIVTEMQNNLPKLSRSNNVNTQSASFQRFASLASKTIDDWRRESARDVNDWEVQYRAGQITLDELLNRIRESMLDHEINNNKTLQSLKSGQNKKIKEQNAKSNASFIFSTIHSAKGLEFDNVVLIYKDNSDMSEPDKRMYYVGMTRAMHSEFILAFNTLKNTRIKNDYDTIVAQLHQTHPMPAPVAQTGATPAYNVIAPAAPVPPPPVIPTAHPPVQPAQPIPAITAQTGAPTMPVMPAVPAMPNNTQMRQAPMAEPPKAIGIKDLFPNATPGQTVKVTPNAGVNDFQLPPGYTFISSDGRACTVQDAPDSDADCSNTSPDDK